MRSRRHRRRWLFVIALLGGLAGFSALWYSATSDPASREPAFGGVYVEGMAGAPARINPLFAGQNAVDETLAGLIFAGLTRLDDEGQPFPDLAETWSVSQDGLVYTFPLRQGLTWQDGAALTADDVVFTYELLRSPGLRATPELTRVLGSVSVSKADATTVRIELGQPYAPLPSYLTLGILPLHLLDNASASSLFDHAFNLQPIGAGPYRLEELQPDHAVLVANPGHHFGQPFVQRLELRFFRDEGKLLAALSAREVQGALFAGGVRPTDLQRLEQRRDLRLTEVPTGETVFIFLNLQLSLFQDPRLRRALLYDLDRQALIDEIFGGQGIVAESVIPYGGWAHVPALSGYDPAPSTAAALLSEAGWRLNERGIRVKDGRELAFTLKVNNDPVRVALANAISASWRELGVLVTIETGGATALVRDSLEPRLFEAVLFSRIESADPDPYTAWHSSQTGPSGANLASYREQRADNLLEEARLVASHVRREQLYASFQELFAEQVPAIPLYVSTAIYVQPSSLQGARVSSLANPATRFWQVQEWYLRTQ